MTVGTCSESTLTRSEVLNGRGYSAAVVAGNGAKPEPEELLEPEVVALVAAETCALAGCEAPLPPRRRRYCSTGCAKEAERRRIRAPGRPSPPAKSVSPSPPAAAPPTDAAGLGLVELVAALLAAGSVAEVQITIAGATVVARALGVTAPLR